MHEYLAGDRLQLRLATIACGGVVDAGRLHLRRHAIQEGYDTAAQHYGRQAAPLLQWRRQLGSASPVRHVAVRAAAVSTHSAGRRWRSTSRRLGSAGGSGGFTR
jgi:hypothetical protein